MARPSDAAPDSMTLSFGPPCICSGFHSTMEKHRRGSCVPIFLVIIARADAAALIVSVVGDLAFMPLRQSSLASARVTCPSGSAPRVNAEDPTTHSLMRDTGTNWCSLDVRPGARPALHTIRLSFELNHMR